ncbi:uncharacterized protein VTP21DRAFT_7273 [Calcarisporiella thermophila]|uniref:uncharacterized protein n=1 Tax=Calcarisporiella thermophila TaxID=911321 RepID=UPI0037438A6E
MNEMRFVNCFDFLDLHYNNLACYYRSKGQIDYDMNAPLNPRQVANWPFPCRGYPVGPAEVTFKAGQSLRVILEGSATHGGGHCQFALQYNNGPFVVFETFMERCPLDKQYTVTIPSTAPAGNAVFVWTWVNAIGNREYYMNCADIIIEGPSKSCLKGKELAVVNYPGYPTIPEFSQDPTHGRKYFDNRKDIEVCVGRTGIAADKGTRKSKHHKRPKQTPTAEGNMSIEN